MSARLTAETGVVFNCAILIPVISPGQVGLPGPADRHTYLDGESLTRSNSR
jgi:hypothetical protein